MIATKSCTSLASAGAFAPPLPDEEVVGVRQDGEPVRNWAACCKRTLRVLVADDCRDAADSLAMLVHLWGHEVAVAYSAEAALEIALADRPDVLLLDIAMPRMSGCELARQLRRHDALADSLLVAISGYADAANRRLGLAAGFHRYLAKPVEPSVLEGLLRREKGWRTDKPTVAAPILKAHGIPFVDNEARVLGVMLGESAFPVAVAQAR